MQKRSQTYDILITIIITVVSDPLPLSFWKLAQKCYAVDKSSNNCECGTTTENDYRSSQNHEFQSTGSLNYCATGKIYDIIMIVFSSVSNNNILR